MTRRMRRAMRWSCDPESGEARCPVGGARPAVRRTRSMRGCTATRIRWSDEPNACQGEPTISGNARRSRARFIAMPLSWRSSAVRRRFAARCRSSSCITRALPGPRRANPQAACRPPRSFVRTRAPTRALSLRSRGTRFETEGCCFRRSRSMRSRSAATTSCAAIRVRPAPTSTRTLPRWGRLLDHGLGRDLDRASPRTGQGSRRRADEALVAEGFTNDEIARGSVSLGADPEGAERGDRDP